MPFALTWPDLLGIVAGTLTTTSFIPQVWRIVQTRSARDISWGMCTVFAAGTASWLAWGIAQRAMPVILANSVTLVLAIAIMALKWRYGTALTPETVFGEQEREST